MQYFDVLIAFAAFLALCMFFNRRCGVAGGRTPLLTCAVLMLWLMVWGVAGALHLGGWLLYAGAAVLGVYSLVPVKRGAAASPKPPMVDFSFALFAGLSLAVALLFAVRQPVFAAWDELSFWGTASKLTQLNHSLYSTATVGWDWPSVQQPGAIMLSYFFQFFGAFAPWKTFLAYDVLLFSVCGAILSGVQWKRYTLGVPAALACLLTPFLMTEYCRILEVTNQYMSAYGDIPAGMMVGGAVGWYFAQRRQKDDALFDPGAQPPGRGGELWGVFPILAAAGVIKENAFPVVLVGAGIIAADWLFFGAGQKLYKRFALAVGALAAPMGAYLFWNRHVVAVVAMRESAGQVGSTSAPLSQVVLMGFQQLLFPATRSETFTQVLADMGRAFVDTQLTLVGSLTGYVAARLWGQDSFLARISGTGVFVAAVILAIFLVVAALCRSRRQRRRTLCAALLSTLGFVGYYWVLVLSYAFIFKSFQSAGLADYNRYVSTYYIFWFLLAVAMLVRAAAEDRPRHVLTGVTLVLSSLCFVAVGRMIPAQMTLLAYPETTFAAQEEYAQRAETVREQVTQAGLKGPIFFVSTGDNGIRYFHYCYEMLPLQMDYSFGGGPIGSAQNNDGSLYYHALSLAEMTDYLEEKGCDYIFLDEYNQVFVEEYAPLFTDGLAAASAGQTRLYQRVEGADVLQYSPCGGDAA